MTHISLLGVDFEDDFTDKKNSALPVPGALADTRRFGNLVRRVGDQIDAIYMTLDMHQRNDISHPGFWQDSNGNHPEPFTIISHSDVVKRIWFPCEPDYYRYALKYTKFLEEQGKYQHMIWPAHCVIGTPGCNVPAYIRSALKLWEERRRKNVHYIMKGIYPLSEHFGALEAEFPDVNVPSTTLNVDFLERLRTSDIIGVGGEALSHCVRFTLTQIVAHIGAEHIKKFHLFTDCMSSVTPTPGSPNWNVVSADFLKDMESRGMTLTKSTEFLR